MNLHAQLTQLVLLALCGATPGVTQAPPPAAAQTQAAAATYAKHGPCWVGARELVIKTPEEGRTLPATLWYPALNPKGLKEVNTVFMDNAPFGGTNRTFAGHALQDAAPDPACGPCPLVVFSHGSAGTRADDVPCMEHWASHGFAVLGLDHGKSTMYRTLDLKSALSFAEQLTSANGALPGFIDMRRVAAAGYSLGGTTALQLGGARYAGLSAEAHDPRVKALVLMAPPVKPESLDVTEVVLPTLVLVGAKDTIANGTRLGQVYQAMPASRKALVTFAGGSHDIFIDPFLKTFWPELDWGDLDMDRVQGLIHHFTTAFLLDALKNDPMARKALLPESVVFTDVQYVTTIR